MEPMMRDHLYLPGIPITIGSGGNPTAADYAFPYGPYAGGEILVPLLASYTLLTFFVTGAIKAPFGGGVYVAAQDGAGNAVTLTVAAGMGYPIPDALYGCGGFKMIGNQVGVADVSMKA